MKYLEQLFAFDFIKGLLLNPSAREVIEHIDSTYLVIVLLYKFNSCFLLLNIQLVNSVVLKNETLNDELKFIKPDFFKITFYLLL